MLLVADVADAVAVLIGLVGVQVARAVVLRIEEAVTVGVSPRRRDAGRDLPAVGDPVAVGVGRERVGGEVEDLRTGREPVGVLVAERVLRIVGVCLNAYLRQLWTRSRVDSC